MKLTRSLVKTLDAIRPYDGDEGFAASITAGKSPIDGYSARRIVHDMGELRNAGAITVFEFNGSFDSFDLTAEGRDYHRNRAVAVVKAVGGVVIQLFVGACGGLVVWLLTWLSNC